MNDPSRAEATERVPTHEIVSELEALLQAQSQQPTDTAEAKPLAC